MKPLARVALIAINAATLVASGVPLPAGAQSTPGGQRGPSSDSAPIHVPLTLGGDAIFKPDGPFAVGTHQVDDGFKAGLGAGAGRHNGSGGGSGGGTVPVSSFPLPNLQALEQQLLQARAANCLTAADTAPCAPAPATAPDPGAFDILSTEVDLSWLAKRVPLDADGDAPLPDIRLSVNPTKGITQMDAWFWVDPTTYAGQPYPFSVHIESPWVLMWKTRQHHHDEVHGACPDNPDASCVTGSHDWDEIIQHSQNHLDVVDVTVTLTPTVYAWDFGDDAGGPWRPDSHASFSDKGGLGQAFTDAFHASSVVHTYSQSSLKVFAEGGFLVQLNATWAVAGHVVATRDGTVVQDTIVALPERTGLFSARYQVRESQPVLRSSAP